MTEENLEQEKKKKVIDKENNCVKDRNDHEDRPEDIKNVEEQSQKMDKMEENIQDTTVTEEKVQEENNTTTDETKADDEQVEEVTEEVLVTKIEELEATVAALKDENEGYHRNLSRLKADFNNYRRRVKKEKVGMILEGKIELVEEILPVIDNFERALQAEDEESEFKEGVEMIYRQLVNALKQEGLEVIPAEGEPFDHKCHEAIMQVEDAEEDSGIIVEELQKGYIFNDKVIRPSMVKVVQ